MYQLVCQRKHVEQAIEVADGRMQVDRLNGITANKMQAVKALGQSQEVLVVRTVSDAPATVQIGDIRRARDLTKRRIRLTEHELTLFIAGGHHDAMRCFGNLLHHKPAIHPDRWRIITNIAACLLENLTGAVMQKIDANLFEDLHGGTRGSARRLVHPTVLLVRRHISAGPMETGKTVTGVGRSLRALFRRPCPGLPVGR